MVWIAAFASVSLASRFPSPIGYVNDFADKISSNAELAMERIAQEVKSKTGAEIVVATIQTCGGVEIEQYAVDLFMEWGIGERGKDNGILILVAFEDRKVFIKTGYGMEGIVPDAEAYRIYKDIIVPGFRLEKYDEALVTAVSTIARLILSESGQTLSASDSALVRHYTEGWQKRDTMSAEQQKLVYILTFFFIVIVLLIILRSMSGTRGYRRHLGGGFWIGGIGGSGGFGGGFGGFGGGSCGGGGAGGGW